MASSIVDLVPILKLLDNQYFIGWQIDGKDGEYLNFNQQTKIQNSYRLFAKVVPVKIISAKDINLCSCTTLDSLYLTDLSKTVTIDNRSIPLVALEYSTVITSKKDKSLTAIFDGTSFSYDIAFFDYFWQGLSLNPIISDGKISLNIPIIDEQGTFFGDGYRLDGNDLFFSIKFLAVDSSQNISAVYYWAGTLFDYQEVSVTLKFENKDYDDIDQYYLPITKRVILGTSLDINESNFKKTGRVLSGWKIKGTEFYFDFSLDVFTADTILVAEYTEMVYNVVFLDKDNAGSYIAKDNITQSIAYFGKAQPPLDYIFNIPKGHKLAYWTDVPHSK